MSKRKLSDSVGNRQTKRRAQQEVNEIMTATTFNISMNYWEVVTLVQMQ